MNYKLILSLIVLSLFTYPVHAEDKNVIKDQIKQFKVTSKEMRDDLKKENTDEWKKMIEENKEEREVFREKVKDMIISKTPEELKNLMPTIKNERKDLHTENKEQRQNLRKENKQERKDLREQIKAGLLELRKKFFGL